MFTEIYNCDYLFSNVLGVGSYLILSWGIFVLFCYLYFKDFRGVKTGNFGVISIFIGGVLNTIERLEAGCVRDYINFFGIFHFNFYDILVISGVLLVLISIWKKKQK